MTFDDFMRLMLTTWPDAEVHEDLTGHLVVFTNHKLVDGNVVRIPNE